MRADQQYQQAGLVVYGDDDNYAKMVIQGRAATATPDHAQRIFQFIREEAGAPNEVTASNTSNLGDAFPDTFYVRFSSNGTNLNASYSADGTTFTAMSETKQLAGITNPRIGLISFASTGQRTVVDAKFDWFSITPDDTATGSTDPNDEFNGTTIDPCRWNAIVRPDAATAKVTGGNLELTTTTGDIYGTGNSGPKNFILQTAPSGDWTLETKVDASALSEQYQQGGLMVYTDDDNYVKFDLLTTNAPGATVVRGVELRSEVAGTVTNPQPNANPGTGVVWLRLKRTGTVFAGFVLDQRHHLDRHVGDRQQHGGRFSEDRCLHHRHQPAGCEDGQVRLLQADQGRRGRHDRSDHHRHDHPDGSGRQRLVHLGGSGQPGRHRQLGWQRRRQDRVPDRRRRLDHVHHRVLGRRRRRPHRELPVGGQGRQHRGRPSRSR